MADSTFYPPSKFGDSSLKTDKDIEDGGISGRGIQNFDEIFRGMPSAVLPSNLVILYAKMWDLYVFYRFEHQGVSTCYQFPKLPEVVEP